MVQVTVPRAGPTILGVVHSNPDGKLRRQVGLELRSYSLCILTAFAVLQVSVVTDDITRQTNGCLISQRDINLSLEVIGIVIAVTGGSKAGKAGIARLCGQDIDSAPP